MKTNTKYFGEITYEAEDILSIPEGLFGFETEKSYLLIHFDENDSALLCLQNLQDEDLAFVLTNPFCIMPDYRPVPAREDMEALGLSDDSEVTFYSICVIHDKLEDCTVNLKCPLVINPETRHARQIILDDTSYTFKHPLKRAVDTEKEGGHC